LDIGRWVREDVGDKAAMDHMQNTASETICLKLPSSVKFAVK
jgi:hypothetical protein